MTDEMGLEIGQPEGAPQVGIEMGDAEGVPTITLAVEVPDSVSEHNAEAWATGQRAGTDVGSSDPTYHNNAKFYATQAEQAVEEAAAAGIEAAIADVIAGVSGKAEDAESWAVGKRDGTDVASPDPAYHNNAKYYAQQASSDATTASGAAGDATGAATAAAGSASAADDSAEDAEAWAVGKRDGVDVETTDPAYHNNAKYYAQQASQAGRVLSVNGMTGHVLLNRVQFADDLESVSARTSTGKFLLRNTGGLSPIATGPAWLASVQGECKHTGRIPELVFFTTSPTTLAESVTLRENAYKAAAQTAGVKTFTYSSGAWDIDPEDYGITVDTEPADNSTITVTWYAENLGTIYATSPASLVSTGWNLYDHTHGYARVVRYSTQYGYKISGNYTALAFSGTLNGTQTALTATDGYFNLPNGYDEGFVFVTGGDSTTTAIWATLSDWTETANGGVFEAYEEDSIDLSGVVSTYFPYGMRGIGSARDEINLSIGLAIVRIERMSNTAANLATAKASGRDYDVDENYIYIVKAQEEAHVITLAGDYDANDHGLEWFTHNMSVPVAPVAMTIYGENLKGKLERDVVTLSQQTLESTQQAQVRTNLGLGAAATKGVANNATTTTEGYVADARQIKSLNDNITTLTTKIANVMKIVDVGSVSSSASKTITFSGACRFFLIGTGNAANKFFAQLIHRGTSTIASADIIAPNSIITITKSASSLTIASSDSAATNVILLVWNGADNISV